MQSKITQHKSPENVIQLQGSKYQPWEDPDTEIIKQGILLFL